MPMHRDKKTNIFNDSRVVVVLAVITTLLWGSAFPCVKIGYALFQIEVEDLYSKILFAGYRFFLAGVMVLLLSLMMKGKLPRFNKESIKGIVVLGVVQTTFQYAFFYIGLAHTTGVRGSILYSANTFITVILAHFFCVEDKLNSKKIIACTFGMIGVMVINFGGDQLGGAFNFLGDGMVLLAASSSAVGALINKQVAIKEDVMTITGYQLLMGGSILIILGIAGQGELHNAGSPTAILMLVYLALLSGVSFTLWTILLKNNDVGKIAIYNFLIPIFGALLSAIFLREKIFELNNMVALVLVCLGIIIINKPKLKK